MNIGLASCAVAESLDDALERIRAALVDAASREARIVCFPEAYVPGLRGQDFEVLPFGPAEHERTLESLRAWAKELRIAAILGMERLVPEGRQVAAYVVDAQGELLGWQTKTQIAPSEDPHYVPGDGRRMFEVEGLRFGIAICHEGWRYPETVRWAAVRGAHVVFHPQHTGSDREGPRLSSWGSPEAPYYEQAMRMRSIENAIYFASVNYGLRFQESATSLIDPTGRCQAHLPYGEAGVLVERIDPSTASGLYARRFDPRRYHDESQ